MPRPRRVLETVFAPDVVREVLLTEAEASQYGVPNDAERLETRWGPRILCRIAETWLEQTFEVTSAKKRTQWVAAHRLGATPQGHVITTETRIFPYEKGRPRQWVSRWSAEVASHRAAAPWPGITRAVVKALPISARQSSLSWNLQLHSGLVRRGLRIEGNESAAWFVQAAAKVEPARLSPPHQSRRGRPPRLSDHELARVAQLYVRLDAEGRRDPVLCIARRRSWTSARARGAVARARQRELLTNPGGGSRGGQLTLRARELLKSGRK